MNATVMLLVEPKTDFSTVLSQESRWNLLTLPSANNTGMLPDVSKNVPCLLRGDWREEII